MNMDTKSLRNEQLRFNIWKNNVSRPNKVTLRTERVIQHYNIKLNIEHINRVRKKLPQHF